MALTAIHEQAEVRNTFARRPLRAPELLPQFLRRARARRAAAQQRRHPCHLQQLDKAEVETRFAALNEAIPRARLQRARSIYAAARATARRDRHVSASSGSVSTVARSLRGRAEELQTRQAERR